MEGKFTSVGCVSLFGCPHSGDVGIFQIVASQEIWHYTSTATKKRPKETTLFKTIYWHQSHSLSTVDLPQHWCGPVPLHSDWWADWARLLTWSPWRRYALASPSATQWWRPLLIANWIISYSGNCRLDEMRTLMDSRRPPWVWPFSALPSSSRHDVNPSMLCERLCSSSWRLSNRAARVRSCAQSDTNKDKMKKHLHSQLCCVLSRMAVAVLCPPLDGRSDHSCSRPARHWWVWSGETLWILDPECTTCTHDQCIDFSVTSFTE